MFSLYITSPDVLSAGQVLHRFVTRLHDTYSTEEAACRQARDACQALGVRVEVWKFGDRNPCYVVKPN